MLPTPEPLSRKRKVVCSRCRSRKKRCDGLHPACTSCQKWNENCDYTPPLSSREKPNSLAQGGHTQAEPYIPQSRGFYSDTTVPPILRQGFGPSLPFPLDSADYISPNAPSIDSTRSFDESFQEFFSSIPITPDTHPHNSYAGNENVLPHLDPDVHLETPLCPPHQQVISPSTSGLDNLPQVDRLVELADIFLDQFDLFLPFLHRASFRENIKSQELLRRAPVLVYAVISMAARSHPDLAIQAQKEAWYCKAKELYAETMHDPHQPLQIVQAATCIIFQALMSRDYSVAWLVMGKAWRQAVALGFHRLEGDSIRSPGQAPEPKSLVEKEEQRRTMWTLFILDRGMCFPVGLPHAIDDRQFMANLPLDTSIFQGIGAVPIESAKAKPFMRNFTKLLTSIQTDPNDPSPDLFHFIIVSYVLLGRVAEHIQAPYASTDPDEYESEFRSLEADLIRLRLSIPRCASSVPPGPTNTSKHAVWLNTMVNASTILLHSRSKPRGTETPVSDQETHDGCGAADVSQETKDSSEKKLQWSYCLAAAHNTVDIVKNASRVSLEILFNPHIPVAFYFAGRVLALEYVDTKFSSGSDSQQQQEKCESLRTEIDFLLLLFDRITEVFQELGTKFKSGLLFDLDQDVETVRRIKTEGIRSFLGNCRGWSSRANDYRQPS